MAKKSFVSNENCTNLFAALTEFRREAKKNFEPVCKEKKYMKKGVFDKEKYFTQLLKDHGIDRNYISYIKETVHEDRFIPRTFSKWNDTFSKPTMEIAERIAEEAVKKLYAYQKAWKLKHKQTKAIQSLPENLPQTMADIVIDLGEESPSLLEDVEIVNPQRLEDNILDGYNEITGEFDNLPEESTCVDIFSGLSDDDLIEELRRRHPKAKSIHVEYEY